MALDVYKEWLGIPEGPRPPDHYQLLRLVQFEDSVDKIRGNYKKLNAHVRKYATGQYSIQSQELLNELARGMLCLTDVERKREYDQGLGREFEDDQSGRKAMDAVLLAQGHVSASQLKEARQHMERTGLELRDSLVQLKMVEPATAAQALAQEIGLPYLDLVDVFPEDAVLDRVPREVVKQHSILPLFIDQDTLLVACCNQIDHELEEELRLRFSLPVRTVLTTPQAISQGIAKYYAPGARNAVVEPETPTKSGKAAKKAAPKAAAAPTRAAPLSEEERKQRKQYGMILFCWSFVLAYLLDWYVISPRILDLWTIVLYATFPTIAGVVAWQMFWKK